MAGLVGGAARVGAVSAGGRPAVDGGSVRCRSVVVPPHKRLTSAASPPHRRASLAFHWPGLLEVQAWAEQQGGVFLPLPCLRPQLA